MGATTFLESLSNIDFHNVLITIIIIRLNNEQRGAIVDYFRVYKVLRDALHDC